MKKPQRTDCGRKTTIWEENGNALGQISVPSHRSRCQHKEKEEFAQREEFQLQLKKRAKGGNPDFSQKEGKGKSFFACVTSQKGKDRNIQWPFRLTWGLNTATSDEGRAMAWGGAGTGIRGDAVENAALRHEIVFLFPI
ncbi:Hypothetical predicted protein [Olea europaea subsp. europaea]|uniref:Uncharacterized protein n=1 Tax=Olea europaea subsp. europaea TaxID=158383 RepID=A0A8S0QL29_OLEEU|nr:Hypothetical predicted protein [Olea europaea subsp. europaea]